MDWSELTPSDWMALLVYGTLATSVALALPGLFRGRISTGLAALAFWGATLFAVLAGYAYRYELGSVAERVMAVFIPGTVVETGVKEVTVFRQADGQFVVNAGIGAAHVSLVVDTGASSVVLRAEDAAKTEDSHEASRLRCGGRDREWPNARSRDGITLRSRSGRSPKPMSKRSWLGPGLCTRTCSV